MFAISLPFRPSGFAQSARPAAPVVVREAPALGLLLGEARVARDWAQARMRPRINPRPPVGDGAPVLTLPGFLAGDLSMKQMRDNLEAAGFAAHGWQMGLNYGAQADTLARVGERVDAIAQQSGRPVHIVGWSLGGLFAREYAKHHPGQVASVVTMGTPFSGSRRANNVWRLYELIARHSIDSPPIEFHAAPRPDVPTFALWSANDGVIAPRCARGLPEESHRSIELACGHLGFAYAEEAVDAVIGCVLEAEAARAIAFPV